jgi:hypothetical protein
MLAYLAFLRAYLLTYCVPSSCVAEVQQQAAAAATATASSSQSVSTDSLTPFLACGLLLLSVLVLFPTHNLSIGLLVF